MEKEILDNLKEKMEGAISSLSNSLSGLRTGRASTALLDPIKVEAYGSEMPMNQVGSVSAPDAKTLLVQVWDKELVQSAEKAILNSGLGLTPNSEGQVIRLHIPNLSEERRKELVKKANEYTEQAKISVRNIRRGGIDAFKKQEKDKLISEDELKNYSQEIQKITDEFIAKIDGILSKKSKDIMSI
ncbi:ribosome recycling factor [Rickettsiales endosymbiont of Trichoplax sp. H2]|uniref:ribosome recycling factor n=1 Tax=Rickettsiales endosymbiont of Trichoplax sp. H2 TaxID=2021221 RepID=UPI0012B1F891|nr:ribosome recycling factor [Rickettsiales endosymbiont of Trichoplax sp. H2]MSO13892.1 Ribosome-recycling factor [Rickettsiales endosymbiont of Trichoplax sp. H2]